MLHAGPSFEMAARPMSPPGAPPRPSSGYRDDDALSMVLTAGDQEVPSTGSPAEWRRLEAQIIGILGKSDEPPAVDDLARETGLDFLSLSGLLLDLVRRNEITLCGSPGKETVCLSPIPSR